MEMAENEQRDKITKDAEADLNHYRLKPVGSGIS
jgi:hypothetical protein